MTGRVIDAVPERTGSHLCLEIYGWIMRRGTNCRKAYSEVLEARSMVLRGADCEYNVQAVLTAVVARNARNAPRNARNARSEMCISWKDDTYFAAAAADRGIQCRDC
jgi:hypothetical protein